MTLEYGHNRVVHVVYGCSGAGKSWVCRQLVGVYYVEFDRTPRKQIREALRIATHQPLPIVFDPSNSTTTTMKRNPELKFELYAAVEPVDVLADRIVHRGGVPKIDNLTRRAKRINQIAKKYGGFSGPSQAVLHAIQLQIGGKTTMSSGPQSTPGTTAETVAHTSSSLIG